jgi:hypothetical protein
VDFWSLRVDAPAAPWKVKTISARPITPDLWDTSVPSIGASRLGQARWRAPLSRADPGQFLYKAATTDGMILSGSEYDPFREACS